MRETGLQADDGKLPKPEDAPYVTVPVPVTSQSAGGTSQIPANGITSPAIQPEEPDSSPPNVPVKEPGLATTLEKRYTGVLEFHDYAISQN